jgi:enoyl-CoA hydratase/carnithine racemase
MTHTPDAPPVVFETLPTRHGQLIGVARLNRPRQLNAITLPMCELLRDRLREWASNEDIVAVLLEGAGEKGFSAGGDVAEVVRQVRGGGPARFVYGDSFFEVEYQLDRMIHEYPKPLVAWIHGVCMGGGLGLAAGAAIRIVTENVRMAMPEIHIGLFPDVGGGYFLNRVPGAAGTVMALTGLIINEADALFSGLADAFVASELRDQLVDAMLELAWKREPKLDSAAMSGLVAQFHRRCKAGLPSSNLQAYFDALRFIGSQVDAISIRDALILAANEDPWFEAPAKSLARGSPTAAHVSLEYLRRCKNLSLAQVLELDLVLARQFQRHQDFPEGVRALLIDKDRNPSWSPASFEEVGPDLIEGHFRTLPGR